MTLNDLEQRIIVSPYFALFHRIRLLAAGAHCVVYVHYVVVRKVHVS